MIEIRVPFFDTDAMGVVHHANYLRYLEVARVTYLREKGLDYRTWVAKGQHFPLVESHLRYKRPALFEDILQVAIKITSDRMRIIFDYEIFNKETGVLVATGQTQHVCVNQKLKVIDPPEDLLKAISKG